MDLSDIKRIIVHGNCHDGMAAAIILYDVLRIEPEFMTHGSKEYLALEPEPGMLFCDIVPPLHNYKEFIAAGARVLDHHIGVKDIVKEFGDNSVFADEVLNPGVSGAFLAYREVWVPIMETESMMYRSPFASCGSSELKLVRSLEMKNLAELAGVIDTWQKQDPRWNDACAQSSMLSFYSWEYWKKKIDDNLSYDLSFAREFDVGRMIYLDRISKIEKLADKAYTFEHAGYKVAIFNDPDRFTSEVAEVLRNRGINVIAGFFYTKRSSDNTPSVCFSIRTDGSVDASDLAKTVPGGGGHTMAAGFAEVINLEEINAFATFMDIFEDYIDYHKV